METERLNTLKRLLATTALVGAAAAPTAASAANIWAKPIECNSRPGCFLIAIQGSISLGDEKKFDDVIRAKASRWPWSDSTASAGTRWPPTRSATRFRERGYTTYVPGSATCASACAIIWVAATTRQADEKAKIGFHGVYVTDKRGRAVGASNYGNALIGSYLSQMGLSDLAIVYMTEAGPSEANWLSAKYNPGRRSSYFLLMSASCGTYPIFTPSRQISTQLPIN
jgi:hypothetical protein